MAPFSENMMSRNGFIPQARVLRSHDDSWHRGNFKKSELMKQKSAVQDLAKVIEAKRILRNKFLSIPRPSIGDLNEFYPLISWQDMARAFVFIGSILAWAGGLLVIWMLPIPVFLGVCLFPGKMHDPCGERMPASSDWEIFELYGSEDITRVSVSIASMVACVEGLLPLWAVPIVMLSGIFMFPGQLYGRIAFFPAQDEYAQSPGEQKIFEHYPPMGFPDMIRACIFIASTLGCAEGYLPLWSLPMLMLLSTCVFPGQIYAYVASQDDDKCLQSSVEFGEHDVFELYPPIALTDMMRACLFIGSVHSCAEDNLPLWCLPVLVFMSTCVFPGQVLSAQEHENDVQIPTRPNVLEQYCQMELQDFIRASVSIGSIFGYSEGYLPLWALPSLMFLSTCVFPGQVYGQMWAQFSVSFSRQLDLLVQLFFVLPLLATLELNERKMKGLASKDNEASDSQ